MTTIYDADTTSDTVAAPVYYDDPDTYTIAEAWMSSPLGELDGDRGYAEADTTDDRDRRDGSRGKLFAAVAAGVIGGATLGAVLFGYRPVAPPTVVVPGFGVSTEQLPSVSPSPSNSPQSTQKPAAAIAPAPKQGPQGAPNPAAVESKTNEEVAADPAKPPAVVPPVVIDVFIPPLGDKPQPPAPEPPKPEPPKPDPPVFDPPNIDVVQIPDEPDPEPPNDIVLEAPIVDPSLQKPTTDGLKPVQGSRINVNLPKNPPKKQTETTRQVPSSRFNTIAKP